MKRVEIPASLPRSDSDEGWPDEIVAGRLRTESLDAIERKAISTMEENIRAVEAEFGEEEDLETQLSRIIIKPTNLRVDETKTAGTVEKDVAEVLSAMILRVV